MFESLVLPEVDIEAEWFDRIHYHTCGYTHLLDLCLSRPYMHVIQYSPNLKESKEESSRLPFYRRVQEANRCLDSHVSPEQVEYVIRHLSPKGLHIRVTVKSVAKAEELLENAVSWSGSHMSRSA